MNTEHLKNALELTKYIKNNDLKAKLIESYMAGAAEEYKPIIAKESAPIHNVHKKTRGNKYGSRAIELYEGGTKSLTAIANKLNLEGLRARKGRKIKRDDIYKVFWHKDLVGPKAQMDLWESK